MGDLGDRMKGYERVSKTFLPKKSWVIARIDGRSFHNFTKDLPPFDIRLRNAFVISANCVMQGLPGVTLAYHQSDEVSFLFTDTLREESEMWFNGNTSKINSVLASAFTAEFNRVYGKYFTSNTKLATFDCRCFTMPYEDIPNYFVWRGKDWIKNSIAMQAQRYFSHKQLMNKGVNERLELLSSINEDWDLKVDPIFKYGTLIDKDSGNLHWYSMAFDYADILKLMEKYYV